jgi:WS/DGAT/MGAT family acyltransferase
MSKPIAPMDLAFLLTESADSPKHVGVLLSFAAPPGGAAGVVREAVAAYRVATPSAPFDQVPELPKPGLPRWKKATLYDPDYHVQHLLLPPGSNHITLLKLVAELSEAVLDRNRPLFRVWFVEGLEDGAFAMIVKIHHAIVDGKTAMDRLCGSFGTKAGAEIGPPFFALDVPLHKPRPPKNVVAQILDLQSTTRKQTTALASVSFGLLKKGVSRLLTGASSGSMPFIAPRTPMNEPLRAPRSFATMTLPLQEMRAVGKAFDGTINDVAVAVFDEGAHRYLRQLGKDTKVPLVGMLPVSLREPGDREATTKASMIFAPLGAPSLLPAERMEQVVKSIRSAKEDMRKMSKDAALIYGLSIFGLGELSEATPVSRVSKAVANFILSNVPGVAHPLYLAGAELEGMFPVSTMGAGIGLNATLASYNGSMDFGFVANRMALPNLQDLAEHCAAAYAELKAAAAARPAAQDTAGPVPAAAQRAPTKKAAIKRAPAKKKVAKKVSKKTRAKTAAA